MRSSAPAWTCDRLKLYPAAVAAETCRRIVRIGESLTLEPGMLHDNASGTRFHDPAFRLTSVGFLPARGWIFDLLHDFALRANGGWDYALNEAERMQYAVYRRHDFFEAHKDVLRVRAGAIRKLSVVLQLDPPQAYRGGRLQFLDDDFGFFDAEAFALQGSVAAFAATLKHRVTPVKAGLRRSLTLWFKGPPFR